MPSLTKRLFNNMFWLFISELCTKGTMLLTSFYLARVLNIAGFGKYSLALAVGTYLSIIVDMGITTYGVREVARNRENAASLMSIMNSMRLVLGIASLLLLMGFLVLTHLQIETAFILILCGWYVISVSLSADWVLQGLEQMKYLALANAINSAVFLVSIFLFVTKPQHALHAVFYRSISFLIGSIFCLYLLSRLKVRFSFRISLSEWMLHIREALFFAINAGLNSLTLYIPVFFLGAFATIHDVGLFSASQKLVLALVAAAALIGGGSYPVMSDLEIHDRQTFNRLHESFERLMLFFGLPIGISGMVLSKQIISNLYGPAFAPSSTIFSVLVWMVPLLFVRTNYGRALASAGLHRLISIAAGSGLIITIVLCLPLIQIYGAKGASFAAVSGEAVIFLVMWIMFRMKIYRSNPFNLFFLKTLFAGMITGLLIYKLKESLIISVLSGMSFYAILSLLIGLVSIQRIKNLYGKITDRAVQI